jgi:hypothetical protein
MLRKSAQFLQYVLPAVIRPLTILWNQVIGFVFLVFAVWSGVRTAHSIRSLSGGTGNVGEVAVAAFFTAIMAGFGIHSFYKARKISKT